MKVILAQPRGYCAGVVRAIEIVERALEKYGAPVYVRHEIVHNRHVVDSLRDKGARFVEELSEVPTGAVTIFSAHGVARHVEQEAERRGLSVLDATWYMLWTSRRSSEMAASNCLARSAKSASLLVRPLPLIGTTRASVADSTPGSDSTPSITWR